jgi:Ser/Thr protein kinase RdoA (MazF antagonist)
MTGEQIGGIVRAVVSALGGYLIGKGIADAETVASVGGALATIAVAVWSWKTNKPAVPAA